MSQPSVRTRSALVAAALALFLMSCRTPGPSPSANGTSGGAATSPASSADVGASGSPASTGAVGIETPSPRTILIDTDVAADDLVALSFLVSAHHVSIAGITVSGTGEAHCAGGVDVVLRLLERLHAPEIPVACGPEHPLAGDHAFPDAWRRGADAGSGLTLPSTTRVASTRSAPELMRELASGHDGLEILTLGPLTNLASSLQADPALAGDLGPVVVMGGALHVAGNLLGPGAPIGNTVAEWNVYVDPRAAQVVVDANLDLLFVSLDGTSQVPVTTAFAQRVRAESTGLAAKVLAELFAANPFMTDGSYFLWDPLAAELAAGYTLGTFTPAAVHIEQAEGPESGFTRPTSGEPNVRYLSAADPIAAENMLLAILNGP